MKDPLHNARKAAEALAFCHFTIYFKVVVTYFYVLELSYLHQAGRLVAILHTDTILLIQDR